LALIVRINKEACINDLNRPAFPGRALNDFKRIAPYEKLFRADFLSAAQCSKNSSFVLSNSTILQLSDVGLQHYEGCNDKFHGQLAT
jgi:hypothetical protein